MPEKVSPVRSTRNRHVCAPWHSPSVRCSEKKASIRVELKPPVVSTGDKFLVFSDWAGPTGSEKRDYPLVNLYTESGYITTTLGKNSRENYSGVVTTRKGNTRRYEFLHLESFHDDEFFHTRSWLVPFRHF